MKTFKQIDEVPANDTECRSPEGEIEIVERANGSKNTISRCGSMTDGPTIETADGNKEWWVNGKLHRTDGPAIEDASGLKMWYNNGELHREDGPAIKWADGCKEWWLEGKQLSEEEWKERTKR